LITVYSSEEEHGEITRAELSYNDNADLFEKAPANVTDDSSEVDVA
jgi:hypothetical protein